MFYQIAHYFNNSDTFAWLTYVEWSNIIVKTSYSDNQTSGSISQFNIWHGKHTVGHRHRCFLNEIGDVFPWKVMEEAEIFGAYMDIPSQCDGLFSVSIILLSFSSFIFKLFENYCLFAFKIPRCRLDVSPKIILFRITLLLNFTI